MITVASTSGYNFLGTSMNISDYKVIETGCLQSLTEKLSELIKKGYEPQGGVSYTQETQKNTGISQSDSEASGYVPSLDRITEIVKENIVNFSWYRKPNIYYEVFVKKAQALYCFPVPLDDVGGATLKKQDKAIYFMRYIRQAINNGTFIKGT